MFGILDAPCQKRLVVEPCHHGASNQRRRACQLRNPDGVIHDSYNRRAASASMAVHDRASTEPSDVVVVAAFVYGVMGGV